MTDVDQSASQSGGAPNGGGANGGGSIKEVAGSAMDTAKSTAADLASTVQSKISEQAGRAKGVVSDTIRDLASAVRKAGDELNQGHSNLGRVVTQGADSLESLSQGLSQKGPGEVLDVVREFGRRSPIVLIGGAMLVGLALGRFAKSSQASSSNGGGTGLSTTPAPHPTLPSGGLEVSAGEMGIEPLESAQAFGIGDGAPRDPLASGSLGAGV